MKLEFHPEAELELVEAAVFYEHEVPGLGERLQADIRQATELLLKNPAIGSPIDSSRRKFVLSRFPFSLIYVISVDVVSILAVAHHKRRPSYWRTRQ